ncbi:hypothetical protein BZG36_01304 [Bifiguratus adelaidae]|uniref:FAS1 domain-containing protein n=1 Tax=Bifiguratus adelaidae TaxID=1938954 RepID=A0A261Y578_9FUNG|nr:hypothetical protein BZG36_01304 [Bifiguratus adelaidae]
MASACLDALAANDDTNLLAKYLEKPALQPIRQALLTPDHTFIAPNNAAMSNAIAQGVLSEDGKDALLTLQYHVLTKSILSAALPANTTVFVETLLNDAKAVQLRGAPQMLELERMSGNDTSLKVGDGQTMVLTTETDIQCPMGIVHVVPQLLRYPPPAATQMRSIDAISTFANLIDKYNVTGVTNSPVLTIFAPNNDAWTDVDKQNEHYSASFLKAHMTAMGVFHAQDLSDNQQLTMLSGRTIEISKPDDNTLFINGIQVVKSNILASNGQG